MFHSIRHQEPHISKWGPFLPRAIGTMQDGMFDYSTFPTMECCNKSNSCYCQYTPPMERHIQLS